MRDSHDGNSRTCGSKEPREGVHNRVAVPHPVLRMPHWRLQLCAHQGSWLQHLQVQTDVSSADEIDVLDQLIFL